MPTGPLSPKPTKVATPEPLVVAEGVPTKDTPAGEPVIVAVTAVLPTGLLAASRSRSAGCCTNAAPLFAVGEGWVLMLS